MSGSSQSADGLAGTCATDSSSDSQGYDRRMGCIREVRTWQGWHFSCSGSGLGSVLGGVMAPALRSQVLAGC